MKGTPRGAGRSRREFNWTRAAAEGEARTGTRRREEEEAIDGVDGGGVDGGGDSDARDPGVRLGVEAELEERKSAGAHTAEAMTALNRALRLAPGHILAAHMLVHLTESLPPPRLWPAVDGERGGESDRTKIPIASESTEDPISELVPHRGAGRDGGGFARVAARS